MKTKPPRYPLPVRPELAPLPPINRRIRNRTRKPTPGGPRKVTRTGVPFATVPLDAPSPFDFGSAPDRDPDRLVECPRCGHAWPLP